LLTKPTPQNVNLTTTATQFQQKAGHHPGATDGERNFMANGRDQLVSRSQAQLGSELFFDTLVRGYVEHNRRFLRREWLAQALDAKLAETGCPFVLLTAEPGAGKSVFMAQLAHDHPEWARYFIRRNQYSVLADVSVKSFLLRFGYQLAARQPDLFTQEQPLHLSIVQRIGEVGRQAEAVGANIERLIASPFCQKLIEIEQQVRLNRGKAVGLRVEELVVETRLLETADLLYLALIHPAQVLQKTDPAKQIVILLDALDEIRYHATPDNILSWLANCPELPENIRFVLTSRPGDEPLQLFCDKQASRLSQFPITEQDPRIKDDIGRFVKGLVGEKALAQALQDAKVSAETFTDKAVDKAHGNLGYVDALARGIDQALTAKDKRTLQGLLSLKELPADLNELYSFFLRQIKTAVAREYVEIEDPKTGQTKDKPVWPTVYHAVLGLLAVAMEPLDLEAIIRLGGIRTEPVWVSGARVGLDRLAASRAETDLARGKSRAQRCTV
jgi:hypothetical protein